MHRCRARPTSWPRSCRRWSTRASALGSGAKVCQPAEAVNVTASRRGLYAARALRAGERVSRARRRSRCGRRRVSRRPRWTRWSARRFSRGVHGRASRSSRATWMEAAHEPMNILITAASRRVPLVQAFRNALGSLGVPGRVIVTDVNPLSPAVHVADRAYRVPLAHDPGLPAELLKICETERIQLAIPTIDDELAVFGAARQKFADARCAGGLFVGRRRAALCNDKYATCGGSLPRVCPRRGPICRRSCRRSRRFRCSSSRASAVARSAPTDPQRARARLLPALRRRPIIQEYLDSPEYTIDVLCDSRGRPLSIVPRERVVIRAGVIDRGRTVKSPALIELAEQVCAAIPFVGPDQHPVPHARRLAVDLRNQPALLRRHPADDRRGRRLPGDADQDGAWARRRAAIGEFREGVWMTSYEASFFLEEANSAICRYAQHAPRDWRGRVMRTRAGIILQARIGSSRLPGKALASIGGQTILEHCLRR